MVFSKLITRFQKEKSDHPLGSDENIDAVLADIPQSDPGRLLLDVDHWLDGMEACVAEIGHDAALRALLRLDQFSRGGADLLLARYLTASERIYLSDSVWTVMDNHAAHLFKSYRAYLHVAPEMKSDDDKLKMARCAARALRAWTLRKKLLRFRYRMPGADSWQDAHELLRVIARRGLLQVRVVPYRDETETSPLREYLIGLYLELAPISNMVPQQMELVDGFLRSNESLDLGMEPQPQLSTDVIDLGANRGPRRLRQDDVPGNNIRYLSVLKLRGPLLKLATQVKKVVDRPDWVQKLPAKPEQIESGILTLLLYWAPAPPRRGVDRTDESGDLKVVLGFGMARRMVAVSHFARMGRSFKYEGLDLTRLFDESRFGTVSAPEKTAQKETAEERPEVLSPIEILNKLETGGDKAQMENWMQVDASATGMGAVVPAVLQRHRIGLLICLRYADGIDWRLGIVRRIGRDAENRPSVGVETLGWPSLCALAKPTADDQSIWSKIEGGGHGWLDAILVAKEGKELILPVGAFVAGMDVFVRSEEGQWRVRMDALLDSGPDFDRIEFTRLS